MPEGQQSLVRRLQLLFFEQLDFIDLAPIEQDLLRRIRFGYDLALSLADYLSQLIEVVVTESPVLDFTLSADRCEVTVVGTVLVKEDISHRIIFGQLKLFLTTRTLIGWFLGHIVLS